MKNLYLTALALLGAGTLSAQTLVSTTPENRNVVLEEYTGIHCVYCPDGHKRAQEFRDNNPGDVVLINIHVGGYAVPGPGEPDYRTTFGDALAGQSNLTGYPAGSINRHVWPQYSQNKTNPGTAMSRGDWVTAGSEVLNEKSPVNVGIKGDVDITTRKLTVDVEAYYTDSVEETTQYLNVVLLQSDLISDQTGASSFYPANVLPNGKYIHKHMLRHMITGQWGEAITPKKDSLYSKTYTYTLPKDINGVPVNMGQLEVAVFITETKQEIITGVSSDVTYDTQYEADITFSDVTNIPNSHCNVSFSPMVEVTNNGPADVSSFDVIYLVGTTEIKGSYTGTLKKGDKTTVTLNTATLPAGTFMLTTKEVTNVNGGNSVDPNVLNNYSDASYIYSLNTGAITSSFKASFEGSMSANSAVDYANQTGFGIVRSTSSYIGAKSTFGTMRFNLHSSYGFSGKTGAIAIGELDLSKITNPVMTYFYAYSDGSQGGSKPTIKMEVSEDCGVTWKTVKTTTPDETGQPSNPSYLYVPTTDQYRWVQESLKDYEGKSVLARVAVTPGSSGNALYIDEVVISGAATGIEENTSYSDVNIFPNPFSSVTNVELNLVKDANLSVRVFDAVGKVVREIPSRNYVAGSHNITINADNLERGVYFMEISGNEGSITRKLVIQK